MPISFMPTGSTIHIGNLIKTELERQGRRPAWLAEQLNFERTNVYNIFHRATIDTALLMRISALLNRNFFELYSAELKKIQHGVE